MKLRRTFGLLCLPLVLGALLLPVARDYQQRRLNAELLDQAIKDRPDLTAIENLIAKGADVNFKDNYQNPLLHRAITMNPIRMLGKPSRVAVVKLLIDAGADVNAEDGFGDTTLITTVDYADDVDTVRLLIAKGANVNARCGHKKTALTKAIDSPKKFSENGRYPEVVRLLKAAGAKE